VERKKIISFYQKTPPVNPRSKVVLDKELTTIIKETRENHFGRRDQYFGGSDEDISEFDDGFDAISVPLLTKNKIFGCITLVWPRKYKLHQKIITDHLDVFKKTAAQIAQALEEVDKKLPKG
jgi:IclR family mhp operon transcriptional activator